ncbi:MAG: V-type ATP synthase subunit I [Candidatus Aminicenantaceae bacterium]
MALAEVDKVQIIGHAEVKMELLSSLQEAGLIQLEETNFEDLELDSSSPEVTNLEHTLFRLNQAIDYFSQWEDKGFMKKILAQKPRLESRKRNEILSFDYNSILDEVERLEGEKSELMSEIKFLEKENDFLAPIKDLSLPVASLESTYSTEIMLGSLPLSQFENMKKMIEEDAVWFEVINQGKRLIYILLFYLKKEKTNIELKLKELHFNPVHITEPIMRRAGDEDRIEDVMEKISEEIKERIKKIEDLDKAGRSFSVNREKLMQVHDVLANEKEKILSTYFLGKTEQVFYLEGWVRSSDIEHLKSRLKPFSHGIQLYFRPPLSDEDPPSILENPKTGKPFELVTKLFGLPQRGSFDPTLPLAPFFFIFVGLCVSEAGYGFLVTLLSLLYIKYAKPKGGLLQFLKLLAILGVSNVILGTLVGGWFGFPLRKLMVLDPLQDPLSFLALAIILGFIQVWFGTLLRLIDGIRNRQFIKSIFVQGGWLLLLPSLVLYFLTKHSVWAILSLAGAAGIVFFASPSRNPFARFFGGLYSLYDISRYIADVLSYSRLLALGLATTVIAMVVNTLSQTALGIPWLGWLVAAFIFIGGHLFNLGISFLGGFVHSMRLQFVEFFSKFFRSGGRPFEPFEMESKFVEFI